MDSVAFIFPIFLADINWTVVDILLWYFYILAYNRLWSYLPPLCLLVYSIGGHGLLSSLYSPCLNSMYFPFIYSFIHMCIHCLGHLSPFPLPPCPLPLPPISLTSRPNLFCPLLQLCWREDIGGNKKDIALLPVWDKDGYTERFLALLPCTCFSKTLFVPEFFYVLVNT
jgi:hypothetical protein